PASCPPGFFSITAPAAPASSRRAGSSGAALRLARCTRIGDQPKPVSRASMVRPARGARARIRSAGESPRQAASNTSAATANVLGDLFMAFDVLEGRAALITTIPGRWLHSRPSMRILVAAGAVLILAVIALAF